MKKVTLLLSDKMIYVKGSSGSAVKTEVDTSPETIIKALVTDDYHINYYFEDAGQIEVLKVEEAG